MSKNGGDPYRWYQNQVQKEQSPDRPLPTSQGAQPHAPNMQSAQEQRGGKKHVSEKRILANREAAKHSTGPKSEKGKRRVAMNPIKHGFFATAVVLKDEDSGETQEEFDNLHAALQAELRPVGRAEELIVEDILQCLWRKRRVLRYENGMISDRFSQRRDRIVMKPEYQRVLGKSLLPSSPQRDAELEARTDYLCMPAENADLILRYLATMNKELHRNFALLRQLQSLRQSGDRDSGVALPTDQEALKSRAQTTPKDEVSGNSQLRVLRVQSAGNVAVKLAE